MLKDKKPSALFGFPARSHTVHAAIARFEGKKRGQGEISRDLE